MANLIMTYIGGSLSDEDTVKDIEKISEKYGIPCIIIDAGQIDVFDGMDTDSDLINVVGKCPVCGAINFDATDKGEFQTGEILTRCHDCLQWDYNKIVCTIKPKEG